MIEHAQVETAIRSARSKSERIVFAGALLGAATGRETIIVGGSAIEVLTAGRTASLDIDIVAERAQATRVLESWGFVRLGRVFHHEGWGLDIDLVGGRLAGSHDRVRVMETPYGPVGILGPEDLVVKRLAELKHWNTPGEWRDELVHQIEALLAEYGSQLDEEYLLVVAKRDDVSDILQDFRHRGY